LVTLLALALRLAAIATVVVVAAVEAIAEDVEATVLEEPKVADRPAT
jgi:hypothetical protein